MVDKNVGFCSSKIEATKLVKGGGVYVGNNQIADPIAGVAGLLSGNSLLLRKEKNISPRKCCNPFRLSYNVSTMRSPEMMGFPPVEPEGSVPKQESLSEQKTEIFPKMKKDAESEEKKREWSKRVDAIGREEAARRMPEVLQRARQGLAQLYELLPHDKSVSKEEIIDLIDHTDLAGLLPGMREKLAKPIVADRLNERPKAELIEKGVDALMIWIQGEAMDLSTQRVLDRLAEERGNFYSEAAVKDEREPSMMETEPSENL